MDAKEPSCKAPSEEIKFSTSDSVSEDVPPYYHPIAIELYDKFKDDKESSIFDEYINKIEGFILDYAVKSLSKLKSLQDESNEHKCSSVLQVILERFLFHHREDLTKGACFSQYPVYGTRQSDGSVYTYRDLCPDKDILHYDYKDYKLDKAIHESVCYFISAHQGSGVYTWSFGLPCTCSQMVFMMYMSGNNKAYSIKLAEVQIDDSLVLKRFLKLLFAAVHYRIDNSGNPSKIPFACQPMTHIELRDNFANHDSTRVFLSDRTVYKFYTKGDHKCHNHDIMERLGYFDNLRVTDIGRHHFLLSYSVLLGSVAPSTPKQISSVLKWIAVLHKNQLVHGDIRIGNIVFSGEDGFLIDFDLTAKCGTPYPMTYNNLAERHPTAIRGNRRTYLHDYYALIKIGTAFFSHVYSELPDQCLCSSCAS